MVRTSRTEPLRLCIVHPDERSSSRLSELLNDAGYRVNDFPLQVFTDRIPAVSDYDIILVTIGEEPADACRSEPLALRILSRVYDEDLTVQVLLLTSGEVSLAMCCRAVELGAAGFFDLRQQEWEHALLERLEQVVDRHRKMLAEQNELHDGSLFEMTGIVSQSKVMADLLLQARKAAMISDAPILVYGESGTGKQLLAEAIHKLDQKRCTKPFLSINCAAISGTLAESALFGHKKGAFTGATEERAGYFCAAQSGTVLLDEISELDPSLQPKLLRVLQENRVLPVGADIEVEVDVRVIAASNRRLEPLIEKGRFRLDLYQRLNVITLDIPPLRERKEDIPALVHFFLKRYASYHPAPIRQVDPRVYDVLASAVGKGNVREIENMVRRILVFKSSGDTLELNDIPPSILAMRKRKNHGEIGTTTPGCMSLNFSDMIFKKNMTLAEMIDACEHIMLEQAIAGIDGTHEDLANRLGITRRTFYNKLQKHDLTLSARRGTSETASA